MVIACGPRLAASAACKRSGEGYTIRKKATRTTTSRDAKRHAKRTLFLRKLLRLLLKHADKLISNRLALHLRVLDAGELLEEPVGRVDDGEVDLEVLYIERASVTDKGERDDEARTLWVCGMNEKAVQDKAQGKE